MSHVIVSRCGLARRHYDTKIIAMKRTSLHIGVMIALALWSANGLAAPQFDTKVKSTLTGMKPLTETALSDLAGKITVVSFFANWCPPCTAEFQQLNQLRHDFSKDRVAIVALNLFEGFFPGNNEGRMKRFLKRTKPTFPVLSGLTDDELSKLFGGLERIPMVLIFDQQGRSIFSFVHAVGAKKMHAGYDELAAAIRAKLPAP